MKYLTITLLTLLLSMGALADMKPLSKYVEDYGELDAPAFTYISYRCLGLFGMMKNITKESTQDWAVEIQPGIESRTKELMLVAYNVWSFERKDKSWEAFEESLKNSIPPIADIYQTEANNHWINNGTYLDGNILIEGDMAYCGIFLLATREDNE